MERSSDEFSFGPSRSTLRLQQPSSADDGPRRFLSVALLALVLVGAAAAAAVISWWLGSMLGSHVAGLAGG